MAGAMGIVIVVVVAAAAVVAVLMAATSGRAYDQIGRGGLSLRDGSDAAAHEPSRSGAVAAREREEEIRQMLEARNELRGRHGRELVDVEAELRALSAPAASADPGLEAEIRELVIARNERRARRGLEPLDVDAEVARRIAELGDGP